MANAHPSPAEALSMLVNTPENQDLIVLGHEIDDRGGTEGSYEYVMERLRSIEGETRIKLDERGVLQWALPEDAGSNPNARYIGPIAEYSKKSVSRIYLAALEAIATSKKILSLGGNHLRATEILGILKACHELGIEIALAWKDAHPDGNTEESSETKNVHGMVSAIAMGEGPEELLKLLQDAPFLNPKNIVYIGINAPESQETDRMLSALEGKGVKCITRPQLAGGLTPVYEAIAEVDASMGDKKLWWAELDVDVLADSASKGKVMPNANGMTEQQLHDLCVWMGHNLKMLGCGVSEIAPGKDPEGRMAEIVTDSVAALLKVPNVNFAVHMGHETTKAPHQSPNNTVTQPNILPPSQPQIVQRRRILDFIAAAAATVAAMIVGSQLTKPSPETTDERQEIRQPLGKNYDRAYAFTGISSQNRFQPPGFERENMYSVERLKQELREYKAAVKNGDSMFDYKQRLLFSILYLGELRANSVPMWDHLKETLEQKDYDALVAEYQSFRSSMTQPEQEEINEYLKNYDHPSA